MNLSWQPSEHGNQLHVGGYVIAAEPRPHANAAQHERWFSATGPDGKCVASGYSEAGLAKCKRYCEQHSQRAHGVAATEQTPSESFVCEQAGDVLPAAVIDNRVPTSPAQTALF